MRHTLGWFENRAGSRIYRHNGTCPCPCCKNVLKNGLVVASEDHANYLHMCQNEMGLIYSDKPRGKK